MITKKTEHLQILDTPILSADGKNLLYSRFLDHVFTQSFWNYIFTQLLTSILSFNLLKILEEKKNLTCLDIIKIKFCYY